MSKNLVFCQKGEKIQLTEKLAEVRYLNSFDLFKSCQTIIPPKKIIIGKKKINSFPNIIS